MRAASCFLAVALLFPPVLAGAWPARVLSVHDGDSFRVERLDAPEGAKPVKVRIYGIDCPELGQPYGEEARALTERVLADKMIEVTPTQKAKSYKRVVGGIVLLDDLLVLQDCLVSAGLAWVDDRFCRLPACDLWRLHQREAKAAGRGLWADPAALPPWTWRSLKKQSHQFPNSQNPRRLP